MKSFIKFAYIIYHLTFPSNNRTCRYQPTCSRYLLEAVEKYGSLKGFYLGMVRLMSCHPFSKRPLYDPA